MGELTLYLPRFKNEREIQEQLPQGLQGIYIANKVPLTGRRLMQFPFNLYPMPKVIWDSLQAAYEKGLITRAVFDGIIAGEEVGSHHELGRNRFLAVW